MKSELSKTTSALTLQGIAAILFGIAAVFWPGLTLKTLVYLFGAFILVAGIIQLITSLGRVTNADSSILTRVVAVLLGLLELALGVYLLRHPTVTFGTLILLIGFMLIVRGVFEVIGGLFEEGPSLYRIVMIVVGLLGVLVGVIVLFQPVASGVAFVWLLGLYALIAGPLLIAGAVETNNLAKAAKR